MATKKKNMYQRSKDCIGADNHKYCGGPNCKWYDELYSHCTLYDAHGKFIGKPKCVNCGKPISKEAYETDASYCGKCNAQLINAE
jgi:hypothetical protein